MAITKRISIPKLPAKRRAFARKVLNITIKRSGKRISSFNKADYKATVERVDTILTMLLKGGF